MGSLLACNSHRTTFHPLLKMSKFCKWIFCLAIFTQSIQLTAESWNSITAYA
ncbi:MAG: hypothetical protein K2P51_05610 [Rhabdochlamydiaceae bacterium]|nr:hypothetical protein [Rhabdochlamydiaceae bacterium]